MLVPFAISNTRVSPKLSLKMSLPVQKIEVASAPTRVVNPLAKFREEVYNFYTQG